MRRLKTGWYKGTIKKIENFIGNEYVGIKISVDVHKRALFYYMPTAFISMEVEPMDRRVFISVVRFLREFRFKPDVNSDNFYRRSRRLINKEVDVYIHLMKVKDRISNHISDIRRIK